MGATVKPGAGADDEVAVVVEVAGTVVVDVGVDRSVSGADDPHDATARASAATAAATTRVFTRAR